MNAFTLIFVSILLNLAAFVCYPDTGPMGQPLIYIFILLWAALGFFITRYTPNADRFWKFVILLIYSLACAFSALSFLPQKDGVSPFTKVWNGQYPTDRSLYFGLLKVGIDYPALLPPQKEQTPP
jgi:hypothetical protein